MAVELYHFWSSVCSVRARHALEEKGVAWTSRYIDLFKFDQMQPAYLKINPHGVVPTLVHDGQPITESNIIIEYVDDAFPGPSLKPKQPLELARMREFLRMMDDEFPAIVLPTMVKYLLPKLKNRWSEEELKQAAARRPTQFYRDMHGRGIRGEVKPEEIEACLVRIEAILDKMEAMLEPGPWLLGAQFTLADISVAPYMFRLLALGQERFWSKTKRPRVAAWYDRMAARPAFQKAASWPDESGGGYEEVGLTTARAGG